MAWFKSKRDRADTASRPSAPLALERLESRTLLNATATLSGLGVLGVTGSAGNDYIFLSLDAPRNQIVVSDGANGIIGRFDVPAVAQINIDAGAGNDRVRIAKNIYAPATILGGAGNDALYAGGGPTTIDGGDGVNRIVAGTAPTTMTGGSGVNRFIGGQAADTFNSGPGQNVLFGVKTNDTANTNPGDHVVFVAGPVSAAVQETLTIPEVMTLLQRAAGASASSDGIIAIVDRNGTILGVRVESGVVNSTGFAIDGAISLARTGAFFGNNQAPLTSRTIQFISQSTITQREVEANPNLSPIANPTTYGPGWVAPVGIGSHFPPGVPFTPQVDLFAIEHTNRDKGPTLGMPTRFNAPLAPGVTLAFPNPYDFQVNGIATAQNRGIATLPGGIPLYKNGQVVGGIGVFFPGVTGFATEENSVLSTTYNPLLPDRSQEAEYIAFAAAGAIQGTQNAITNISGPLPQLPGFVLPFGRIDLVGITLPLFGPGGRMGVENLFNYAIASIRPGNTGDGADVPVDPGLVLYKAGMPVPDGFLVQPQAGAVGQLGVNLTPGDINRIITQAVNQANVTRAQIRTPAGVTAKFTIAVVDLDGNVVGLFRQPDGTVFSIDVAVAKARNVAYYASNDLQPQDRTPGVPTGVAFTNRTFRYEALPRFPEGIDGFPPGPFSILNDGGVNPTNGLRVGPPLPASAFQSVLGFDSFNPETNFRDPGNPALENGVVFFPGSMPLYKINASGQYVLVGGVGVSGDGVDEDDVVTFFAAQGFYPADFLRADNYFVRGVRLPFQKFDRNPEDL